MAVAEPEPDGAGIAAVYRTWAAEHSTEAVKDYHSQRPVRSAKHTEAMRRLNRAARAEVDNPAPDGLEPPPPLLEAGEP